MNGLKFANDVVGHEAGDALLLRVVALLEKYSCSCDSIYRIGGDEFVVIVPGIEKERFDAKIAALKEELRSDWIISCGGVWFESLGNVDRATRIAEKSMYQNKADFYRTHPEYDRRLRRENDKPEQKQA